MQRRDFIQHSGTALLATGLGDASSILDKDLFSKRRVALVGTGIRGIGFWGERVAREYSDLLEWVGLCDKNPGRVQLAKEVMKVDCPVFTDFDKMLSETKPELLIVTTMDSTHHEFIIRALDFGCDVLTEKPLTTNENKCQQILDAERRNKGQLIVGFNYRWSPYMTRVKELLSKESIGDITSVDFHWYLNLYHGASYFRRWHGQREYSGTLLVHKATHHFDLLNWWIDSDPLEVMAYGSLEHYGRNSKYRGTNCRNCSYKKDCRFYWDITAEPELMRLYVDNEHYDGYIRDNCLFREEINIYDKMSAQIRYANNVLVNYSLTTYSPFEGWRIAFNGKNGRIEAWEDIPYYNELQLDQSELHRAEMAQDSAASDERTIILHKNWQEFEKITVENDRSGHGGGDGRLQDKIFRYPDAPDPLRHAAGSRDGAMSMLIGVAARKSIESGRPVRISELTDLEPSAKRIH